MKLGDAILGAVLIVQRPNGILFEACATIGVALLGLVASYRIPLSPAPVSAACSIRPAST